MDDIIFSIVILLLESLLFYFMPTWNGRNTLFGFVLKEKDFQNEGILILKQYRRNLIFVFGIFILIFFLCIRYSPESLIAAYISAIFAQIVLMFIYFHQAWRVREEQPLTKFATILKARNLSDFTKIWLEAAVVLLSIAPFAILAFYYSQLPEVVPIHWNWRGEPDGWQKKGFAAVFFLPALTFFLQILLFNIKKDIIGARFRVPSENAEKVAELKESSLQINIELMDWCRLMSGILLAAISLLVLTTIKNFNFSSELNIILWTSLILLLAGGGFYIYQLVSINRAVKNLAGQINFQTHAETKNWNGGLFYYNKNDPAFLVEKQSGFGYTFNFAHKKIWFYAALFFLPEILLMIYLTFIERH